MSLGQRENPSRAASTLLIVVASDPGSLVQDKAQCVALQEVEEACPVVEEGPLCHKRVVWLIKALTVVAPQEGVHSGGVSSMVAPHPCVAEVASVVVVGA